LILLTWTSFPVLVLAILAFLEVLNRCSRRIHDSRWWFCIIWFWRPYGLWAIFNIIFRALGKYGFNNRKTFPFYFNEWNGGGDWSQSIAWLLQCRGLWFWSCVLFALAVVFLLFCRWLVVKPLTARRTSFALIILFAFGFVFPLVYDCLPEGAQAPLAGKGSFCRSWYDSGNTMLYCMPYIRNQGHYLRNFQTIQPQLTASIHGVTHPPGASLALYWMGKLCGATENIHTDKVRYALGNTLFAALGTFAMFLLGRSLFRSNQVGIMGAALWTVMPAALAYNTFAPDPVYTVFYILWLGLVWQVATAEKRPWMSMFWLGIVFYALTMLNFIWPLLAGIFGVTVMIFAYRQQWKPQEWVLRCAVPMAIMLILLAWTCYAYCLDYIAIFQYALTYYGIRHAWGYKKVMEIVGGQIDLYIMMGSLCAGMFWNYFPKWIRQKPFPPQAIFFLVIIAFQLTAIVFLHGPAGEASRIWPWIAALPLAVVADRMLKSEHAGFYFIMALLLAMLQYYAMRLFLVALA
jgi:hypothetical protein